MTTPVRLDKWLWAARLYKTRPLAAAACAGGKVQANGARAKASKAIQPGDRLLVRQPPFELELVVRAVSEKRGPARSARALYEETVESARARAALALRLRLQPVVTYEGKGRPTKKARRDLERLKGPD